MSLIQDELQSEVEYLEFLKGIRAQIISFDPNKENDNLKEALFTLDRLIARSLFKTYELGEK